MKIEIILLLISIGLIMISAVIGKKNLSTFLFFILEVIAPAIEVALILLVILSLLINAK